MSFPGRNDEDIERDVIGATDDHGELNQVDATKIRLLMDIRQLLLELVINQHN